MENIGSIIREYKDTRGLQSVRICILGAPDTGKTYFATRLCSHFKLHHLTIQSVIKESVEKLVSLNFFKFYQICNQYCSHFTCFWNRIKTIVSVME